MGREHSVPRNSRLREKGHRRNARVSHFVFGGAGRHGVLITRRKIILRNSAPIAGLDVGEDYLDLAVLSGDRAALSYHRITLAGLRSPVSASLAARIADAAPALRGGALAL